MRKLATAGIAALTFVVGIGIGAASSGGGSTSAASTPTATKTVPGPTVTETATAGAVSTKTVKVTHTVTQKPPQAASSFAGTGMYEVGADIKPGTYASKPDAGGLCYWERLKSADGSMGSIIANEDAEGPTIVTIAPTDKYFQTSGCADWVKK